MADPLVLHPSVRERREPRISAASLAEYLIMNPDAQETVLHDARFSRPPIVTAYADALRALRAYNVDARRPKETLTQVKEALILKASSPEAKPKARDEAMRCIEAIELFERSENEIGMRALKLAKAPRFDPLLIHGVEVSVRPDFIVHAVDRSGKQKTGAGLLRLAKAPDPGDCKQASTSRRRGDHRREMGRYMVALLQMLLVDQPVRLGEVDRGLCFVVDVRLGERIDAARDHTRRIRSIEAACRQIARLWNTIDPRPSILKRG